jgi:ATP-dependent protease ClpP protease subunit
VFKFIAALILAVCSSAYAHEAIVLTTVNSLVLRGPIDGSAVLGVQDKLAKLAMTRGSKPYAIYLVLDSPGGEIDSGNDLIQFAKTVPNLHTISIFSASMATAIVQQLPGNRYITDNGILMFHRATGGFRGQFETGEVESRLGIAKRLVRRMEELNSSRMRMKLEDYKSLVKDELWLDSDNAELYRAADKVVDIHCTQQLFLQKDKVVMSNMLFSAEVVFSGCPLLRVPINFSVGNVSNVYKVPTMQNYGVPK